ncbi:DUF4091 domain-containing protein, partial [bacterium]|nr:DUF4091 domain-containing protein [candidate division CSSED10-310 bacterium]
MKRLVTTSAMVSILAYCGLPPVVMANQVWVAPAIEAVGPNSPQRPMEAMELWAARGEVESFQVVLHGATPRWTIQNMVTWGLKNTVTGEIGVAADDITLYLGFFVPPSGGADSDSDYVVDPLIPLRRDGIDGTSWLPLVIPMNENRVVFVDIAVPRTTPPGDYRGRISIIYPGNPMPEDVMITLHIWDRMLPNQPSMAGWFGFAPGLDGYHAGTDRPGPERRRMINKYVRCLEEHRVTPGALPSRLLFSATGERLVPVDWRRFDELAGFWFDGRDRLITPTALLTPFNPGGADPLAALPAGARETAIREITTHYREHTWLSRALIFAEGEGLRAYLDQLCSVEPIWRQQVILIQAPETDETIPAGGWCTGAGRAVEHLLGTGTAISPRLWIHGESDPSGIDFTIADGNGGRARLVGWLAWLAGAEGIFHRSLNDWNEPQPWAPAESRGGAGILIYPGAHDGRLAPAGSPPAVVIDGPVPSYRLKMIRDALEDW